MSPQIPGAVQFAVAESGPVSLLLARELGIPTEEAQRLIKLGAVYYQYDRLPHDREIAQGEWLRVHARPRRFANAVADWRERIVGESDDFLVVDKPAGLPVHPTCDNGVENLISHLQAALGIPLTLCQRLDVGTSGLVVLAKNAKFRAKFGRWLEKRWLEKIYRARVCAPVAPGLVVHYQSTELHGARSVSLEPVEGWKRCELKVLECVAVDDAWDLRIQLITGRTHQIRSQLAGLGAPILGDVLYGSTRDWSGGFALRCVSLRFPDGRHFHAAETLEGR